MHSSRKHNRQCCDALAQTNPEQIQAFSQEYLDASAESVASLRVPDREKINIEHCVTGLLDSVTAAAPEQLKQVEAIVDKHMSELGEEKEPPKHPPKPDRALQK